MLISQNNDAENPELKQRVRVLGEKLARCANLSKPVIAFLDNADFEKLFPEYINLGVSATTTYRHLWGIVVERNIYIVLNKKFTLDNHLIESEETVAHEIGHHVFEPSIYHYIFNSIFGKVTYWEREIIATQIGKYRLATCP